MRHRILIGDLNVVPTEQKPTFLPQQRFEYDWYSKISRNCGLYDAAVEHNNAGHENTWVAHIGEGYTYDHILIDRALRPRVLDFHYDHLPRSRGGLTDHSALSIVVAVDAARNLETMKVGTPRQGDLF